MRIADISIKQPVFITMVILLIVVLGVISYTRLGVDMMPEITLPIISITTIDPGARTVPVAIRLFTGEVAHQEPFGQIMAAAIVVTVPLVALVLIFQQKIVAGLTAGAVKG